MKISKVYLPILVFSTLAVGVVLGALLDFQLPGNGFYADSSRNKLNQLLDFIDNEYVGNVNSDSIVDLAVTDILSKLDPHSVYIDKSEMQQVSQSMKGDFVGIGINFYMFKDTVAVISPIPFGPSAKAGIKAGDRILFAGNDKLFGRKLPSDSLFSKLKGEPGSQIMLTIYRKTDKSLKKIKVTRGVVPIKSVDIGMMINKNTGYIKINRFSETTYSEFEKALTNLKKVGANELVLDLRDNGGGYLEEAVKIADDFLKENQLIVFTKDKKGTVEKTFAKDGDSFESGKVFVLINENSASASEILAGALQDNDRATIIGRRSFGKGLVQREMNFGDGSAVRLTVAKYYTPTGRSIQKPYSDGNEAYEEESHARFKNGELYKKDSIKVNGKQKFKTPKGKIVYGGGGIVPDVFVPLEVKDSDEVVYLLQANAFDYFLFEQLDVQRNMFEKMTYPQFLDKMNHTDFYFNRFSQFLKGNGLKVDLEKNKPLIRRYILAEFAKQLFGEEKYYSLLLLDDPMIQTVLKQ